MEIIDDCLIAADRTRLITVPICLLWLHPTGSFLKPSEAKAAGLIDEVVPKDDLMATAESWMKSALKLPDVGRQVMTCLGATWCFDGQLLDTEGCLQSVVGSEEERERERQAGRDRQTETQTQTQRHSRDRQTDRDRQRQTDRETETEIQTETERRRRRRTEDMMLQPVAVSVRCSGGYDGLF